MVGTKALAKKIRNGFPASLNGAPILLPMKNTILRRSLDHWFGEMDIRRRSSREFDDSAMLKVVGSKGMGVFPVVNAIRSEVERMYNVELIGTIPDVVEKFYALSVERKVKHPAVLAISTAAKKKLAVRS